MFADSRVGSPQIQTPATILKLPMGFLTAGCAKGNQILGRVITQSASRLNVMDLKSFHPSTRLATPAVSLVNRH